VQKAIATKGAIRFSEQGNDSSKKQNIIIKAKLRTFIQISQ
jgi:hypothetical protein